MSALYEEADLGWSGTSDGGTPRALALSVRLMLERVIGRGCGGAVQRSRPPQAVKSRLSAKIAGALYMASSFQNRRKNAPEMKRAASLPPFGTVRLWPIRPRLRRP